MMQVFGLNVRDISLNLHTARGSVEWMYRSIQQVAVCVEANRSANAEEQQFEQHQTTLIRQHTCVLSVVL